RDWAAPQALVYPGVARHRCQTSPFAPCPVLLLPSLTPSPARAMLPHAHVRVKQKEPLMTQQKESLITDEMRAVIGKESEPITYEIDNTGCRQFARAVGYTDPIFFDEAAAKAQGYRAIVAPPGFLGNPVMLPGQSTPRRPDSLGFPTNLKRVLTGGPDYEYFTG